MTETTARLPRIGITQLSFVLMFVLIALAVIYKLFPHDLVALKAHFLDRTAIWWHSLTHKS